MNLTELNKIAAAMVAPGRGILAADESSGTIKKRFDAHRRRIDRRRRGATIAKCCSAAPRMAKYISGVILYDETIRQNANDGTPLVKLIEKAGAIPGIKVDKGTKPLPFCAKRSRHRGPRRPARAARRISRARRQIRQVARGDRYRPEHGLPSYTCVTANAHALARYAALCQDEGIVPIVEPEVLMDGDHDIDRCAEVTEWVLKETVSGSCSTTASRSKAWCSSRTWRCPARNRRSAPSVEEVAEKTRARAQGLRAGGRARHRVPLRRPVRRGSDRAS